MKKTKKTILLSLTLASSLLHAEDNGIFLSVGYQIGEAVQKVKNADKVQKLSDAYENLNKLLPITATPIQKRLTQTAPQRSIKRLAI
ncbi:hypothetical protein ID0213_14990 [Helicobacter pylori]